MCEYKALSKQEEEAGDVFPGGRRRGVQNSCNTFSVALLISLLVVPKSLAIPNTPACRWPVDELAPNRINRAGARTSWWSAIDAADLINPTSPRLDVVGGLGCFLSFPHPLLPLRGRPWAWTGGSPPSPGGRGGRPRPCVPLPPTTPIPWTWTGGSRAARTSKTAQDASKRSSESPRRLQDGSR